MEGHRADRLTIAGLMSDILYSMSSSTINGPCQRCETYPTKKERQVGVGWGGESRVGE